MKKLFLIFAILSVSACKATWLCEKCRNSRDYLIDLFSRLKTENMDSAVFLCGLFMNQKACRFFLTRVGNPVVDNTFASFKNTDALCRNVFCFDDEHTEIKLEDFKQFIIKRYPRTQKAPKSVSGQDFKMLVLNDIHLQRLYKEGSVVDCGEVEGCCEERWGMAEKGKGAGYWGTRLSSCDIPTRTFLKTLEHIKSRCK